MTDREKEWVDWLNVKILQKAVIVDKDNNILVLRRTKTGPSARLGKWDLPGGSLSTDDIGVKDPHKIAIRREMKEETGLNILDIVPVYVTSGKKQTQSVGSVLIYAVGFVCKTDGIEPEVILSSEHIAYKWIKKDEVVKLDFGDDEGFHLEVVKHL